MKISRSPRLSFQEFQNNSPRLALWPLSGIAFYPSSRLRNPQHLRPSLAAESICIAGRWVKTGEFGRDSLSDKTPKMRNADSTS